MKTRWRPEGYPAASPYLIADGAQRVIDFLKEAFGATELRRYDMPDGTVMHAEVRIADSVVMIGDAGGPWKATPSHVHVYVQDVDAAFGDALRAGGVSVQDPEQRPGQPDRRGGVRDPAGNTWWLATQLSSDTA